MRRQREPGHGAANPAPQAPVSPPSSAGIVYGSVQVSDQTGDGTRVTVERTELRGVAGYVVIHDERQGGPHEIFGWAPVPEGVATDIVVTLPAPLPAGPYWAMLHRDAGVAGVFEWPGPDGPVRAAIGIRYAQKRFVLTVP